MIAEYDGAGNWTKSYDYLPYRFAPSQLTDANGTYQVHTDHQDTPKFLTDSSEAVVWRSYREAFGEMVVDENPDADANDVVMNVRFPGQYYDQESGTHYNYFRDYDSKLGRYIQSDPIGLLGGKNLYSYTHENPLYYGDPDGLLAFVIPAIPPSIAALGKAGAFLGSAAVAGYAGSEAINHFNKKADDSSKNEKHGNDREAKKREQQLQDLNDKLQSAEGRKEKNKTKN